MPGLGQFRCVFAGLLAVSSLCAAGVTLRGKVVDENEAPVRDARVRVRPDTGSANLWSAHTDPTGAFSLTLPGPGDFLITVDREGYYELKDRPAHIESSQEVTLVINTVREVFQSVNVNAETSPLEAGQAQNQEQLSGTEVNDMPYANSHSLRNSLPLLPGVLQDATGTLHINGAGENQVLYQLNGFNITDPSPASFKPCWRWKGSARWISPPAATRRNSERFGRCAERQHRDRHRQVPLHHHRLHPRPQPATRAAPRKLVSARGRIRTHRQGPRLVLGHVRIRNTPNRW